MTTIRVYRGGGSIKVSIDLMVERLKSSLNADVRPIEEQEIKQNMRWAKNADVILFAGFTVRGFKKALGEQGLSNLYNAVSEIGLTYAGVCAGENLVVSRRKRSIVYNIIEGGQKKKLYGEGIGFYEGYGKGPIKEIVGSRPFEDTINDIHVVDVVRLNGENYKAAYWGGPKLIPFEKGSLNGIFQATSFLKGTSVPLSVVGRHGNGVIALSSIHPEITSWNWRKWVITPNPINQFQQATLNQMDAYLNGEALDYFIKDLGLSHLQIKRAGGLNLAALWS